MDDRSFWDLCYAQIVGIQFHPANTAVNQLTVDELRVLFNTLATVCDVACEVRRCRFG